MASYQFRLEDLARTRFAISPMLEVAASLRRLRDPSRSGIHLPWINELRDGRLREVDLSAALRLAEPVGYMPDFLTPPPSTPLARFEDEVELVRQTTADQVRHDIRLFRRSHRIRGDLPAALQPFETSPTRAVKRLVRELERYWTIAVEPHWQRIRALLEADIAHRAKQLTEGGPAALFEDLHPAIRWSGSTLDVDVPFKGHVADLRGRGLLLVPSAFSTPAVITEEPWQPTLIYPARAVATLWDTGGESTPAALAGVIGRTRAALLTELEAPRSTTDVARLLNLTPGGASQHLTALRAAGLAAARREGRSVLYVRTPLADQLVAAGTDPL